MSDGKTKCEEKSLNNQDASKSDATICSLRFGSLFAGIGGFDLGFERAGMTCAWQVEIDNYANRVLEKHWPDVKRWRDVRTFPPEPTDEWKVDVICGGFPCQDVSLAKHDGDGIDGDRSGLWFEFERVIGILRPRIVCVENTPGLFVRGIDAVLGGLAALGFDAEWGVVSACSAGATHMRKRVFILGYAKEVETWSDERQGPSWWRMSMPGNRPRESGTHWATEPSVARVAYGVPRGMDRCGAVGNAVSPIVAERIGHRIVRAVSVT